MVYQQEDQTLGRGKIMKLNLDIKNPYIKDKTKHVQFLDIETSLVDARVFRPGQQFVAAHQTNTFTRLLTVAGGTMYDLYTKGAKGIWSVSNHHFKKEFKKDPLDDTRLLQVVWDILDKADVIVAHNARFDASWLSGRFLQQGWPLPSKYAVVCTYQGLHRYAFTSKKLDQLSKQLIGTKKIATDYSLWERCSEGEVSAFEEMEEYNKGDIHPTMFNVYMRTCVYFPDYAVDLIDYSQEIPMCKVDGSELEWLDKTHKNRRNGCDYQLYFNEILGITYIDRYNTNSSKAGKGYIREHR